MRRPIADIQRDMGAWLVGAGVAGALVVAVTAIGTFVRRGRRPDLTPTPVSPQWLADHILPGRHVLAVAGTHGKTTTTSMLAWVLDQAGLQPG